MKMKNTFISFLVAFALYAANVSSTLAANLTCTTARGGQGVNTALGCVPIDDTTSLTSYFLGWGMGIAGGVSTILMVYAGIQYMMAQGDPRKAQGAKDLITAAIGGLMFLIFSVFLLRIIGIDILGIPGL